MTKKIKESMSGASEYRSAEDLIQIIDQLPEREVAKLAQHLVGRMSFLDLADLLRAIALRLETGQFLKTKVGQMSSPDLADLIRAIALRVEKGRDRAVGTL